MMIFKRLTLFSLLPVFALAVYSIVNNNADVTLLLAAGFKAETVVE